MQSDRGAVRNGGGGETWKQMKKHDQKLKGTVRKQGALRKMGGLVREEGMVNDEEAQ